MVAPSMKLPDLNLVPPADFNDTPVVSTVADLTAVKKATQTLKFRPLDKDEMALARSWAKSLIPADPKSPPDYINIAKKELGQLSQAVRTMLEGISVEDMKKVRAAASLVLKRVQSVDVSALSPEAKQKFLGIKETLVDIIRRIDAFFDRYRTVQGELDIVVNDILKLRDRHIELKNQVDEVGKETKKSRNVLRIAVEACKIYLTESGNPYKAELIKKVDADAASAQAEGRLPDEDLTEDLRAHKDYLVIVENFMATMEGAIVDAFQTYEGLVMLENNERIIAQTLDNLVTFTIPAWQRLIVLAYVATQGKDAADLAKEQFVTTNQLRMKSADFVEMAAESIAELIVTSSFDAPSMEYMNGKLVSALDILEKAATQAELIHAESREGGYRLIGNLTEAARKYASA
jgi:uncharacterized protein YaaN involved in tellurite resistance